MEFSFRSFFFQRQTSLFIFFAAIAFLGSHQVLTGQTKPSAIRNVTGILRDSLNKPVEGAEVRLISAKDTLRATSNVFGFYGFSNVRSADFLLSVKAIGHKHFNRKYFNNDTKSLINIPPIRLGILEEQLENVTIKRLKGPIIKGDTTEFWAKDYIVRDYARLEDLLKRMEGIRIDRDGSVFYNDEIVARALFNNVEYFSGSVKEAIKELPADIIERIQIIDMDESGHNSKKMKTEKSSKVLNIVTKADKAAGKMYDLIAEQGSQSRMRDVGKVKTIDGSNQFLIKGSYTQEPLGIRPTVVPGSLAKQNLEFKRTPESVSEGQSKSINAGIGKKIQIGKINFYNELNYLQYANKTVIKKIGENYYPDGILYNNALQESKAKNHNLSFSSDFYSSHENKSVNGYFRVWADKNEKLSTDQTVQSGILSNFESSKDKTDSNNFKYTFFTQSQRKVSSHLSMRLSVSSNYDGNKSNTNRNVAIYKNTVNTVDADSILHQLENRKTNNFANSIGNAFDWNYNTQLKFKTGIDFTSQSNLNDTKAFVDENQAVVFNSNLSFLQREVNFAVPVYFQTEYSLKNGITVAPSFRMTNKWLNGEVGLEQNKVSRYDFLPETSFRIIYSKPNFGDLQALVSLSYMQPVLNALNPVPNYSVPYRVTIGNNELQNTEASSWYVSYNRFFRRLQLSANISVASSVFKNGIGIMTNSVIDNEKSTITTINSFTNVDGKKSKSLNFSFGKSLFLNSNIQFTGSVMNSDNPYFLNSQLEMRKSLNQNFKTNFTINYKKWLEIETGMEFISNVDHNTAAVKTYSQSLNGNLNLGLYFCKTWNINIYFQQTVNQITNVKDKLSPFVFNMNIEKRIFKQKNGIVSLVIMDLAKENYLLNYNSFDTGYQQTITNKNSNYFMFQFSWQPQSWQKSRFDNGNGRKGNGSFK